jgi:hypothetical protein
MCGGPVGAVRPSGRHPIARPDAAQTVSASSFNSNNFFASVPIFDDLWRIFPACA